MSMPLNLVGARQTLNSIGVQPQPMGATPLSSTALSPSMLTPPTLPHVPINPAQPSFTARLPRRPAFAPELQQPFSPETHMMGIPDVSDQEMQSYGNLVPGALRHGKLVEEMGLQNQVLRMARMDKIWKQVAREYGVLTGDKKKDVLIWEDHQAYLQGAMDEDGNPIEDPITVKTEARDEFLKRAMQAIGGGTKISKKQGY